MASPPALLTLPPELRNRITELAVYHSETHGIISPRPFALRKHRYVSLIKGVRAASASSLISSLPFDAKDSDPEVSLYYNDNDDGHRCFVQSCLHQPSLTRVCRQLRAEVLPVFYGIHHFHIELDQFRNSTNNSRRAFNNSIDGWLRSIGDTNLRYIRRFTMAAPVDVFSRKEFETVQLSYIRREMGDGGNVTITKVGLGLAPLPAESESAHWQYESGLSRELFVVAMRESGLCVRALECMIASFGGDLQDYSALQVGDKGEEEASELTKLRKLRVGKAIRSCSRNTVL
ncbi:hypothetical protein LTR95_000798 [Oleoguttula sp. CCFEE 5521]